MQRQENREQIDLETKKLERDKIALEIAKLNKSPFKEPAIWVGLVTTLLTLILTGIINFEPLKRQIEINRLQNELEQIKLEKKSYELESRKNKFEKDSILLTKGLDSLKSNVTKLNYNISQKQDSIFRLKSNFTVINNTIRKKQDSLSRLKSEVSGYTRKIVDLSNSTIMEQFNGSLKGIVNYVSLTNNPDFTNCVKLYDAYEICRISIENNLNNSKTEIVTKVIILCIKYSHDLKTLDHKISDLIPNSEPEKDVDLQIALGLCSSIFERNSKMPLYCEKTLLNFFSGDRSCYDDREIFNLFNSDSKEMSLDIFKKRWIKKNIDGTIDKDKLFNDPQTLQEMNKYFYFRMVKIFSEAENKYKSKSNNNDTDLTIYNLFEEVSILSFLNIELSLFYTAKIRLLIELKNVTGLSDDIEKRVNVGTYKQNTDIKTQFGKIIDSYDPTFPDASADVNDFKKWLSRHKLNNKIYSVDAI